MPNYIDQLRADIQPSYTDSLYHYGVKGMRWGIRKYRDENGVVRNKARLGSAERVRQKQRLYQNHLDRSNDDNFILRNTINDYRRGRIAQLNTKAEHREARDAYRKKRTKANKAALTNARNNRLVKNGLLPSVGVTANHRGTYNRYRASGQSEASALLSTLGKIVVTTAAMNAVSSVGRSYIQSKIF